MYGNIEEDMSQKECTLTLHNSSMELYKDSNYFYTVHILKKKLNSLMISDSG